MMMIIGDYINYGNDDDVNDDDDDNDDNITCITIGVCIGGQGSLNGVGLSSVLPWNHPLMDKRVLLADNTSET